MKPTIRIQYDREYALTQVGPGWASLVHEIYDKLDTLDTPIYIDQVKEKFGGLRVYSSPCHDEFDNYVITVCKRSFTLCDECGAPGSLHKTTSGRYATRCTLHNEGFTVVTGAIV